MPSTQSRELHGEGVPVRYSPERPYRPRVSPPSVEDKDACAIYASVRKDATPSHAPIELAIPALQKMLHRAGNVDGEGDGEVELIGGRRDAIPRRNTRGEHRGRREPAAPEARGDAPATRCPGRRSRRERSRGPRRARRRNPRGGGNR